MHQNDAKQTLKSQLAVGDHAPVVSLADHAGNTVALSSLWQSQPRVLLFVRHLG